MATKPKKNLETATINLATVANDIDIADILLKMSQAGAKKPSKKGEMPELVGHEVLADKVSKAYENFKDAEANFRAVEGQLLAASDAAYEEGAVKGDFSKSMKFLGRETDGVMVTYQDRFTATAIEQKPWMVEVMGQESFDKHFDVKRDISVSDTSDATVALLLAKLGVEDFQRIFAVKQSIVSKDNMDQNQFNLPVTCRPKQVKASVKQITSKK